MSTETIPSVVVLVIPAKYMSPRFSQLGISSVGEPPPPQPTTATARETAANAVLTRAHTQHLSGSMSAPAQTDGEGDHTEHSQRPGARPRRRGASAAGLAAPAAPARPRRAARARGVAA